MNLPEKLDQVPSIKQLSDFLRADLGAIKHKGYSVEEIHNCLLKYETQRIGIEDELKHLEERIRADAQLCRSIHSIRWRPKDYYHLADKLRRKCLDRNKPKIITAELLLDKERGVTDLGGMRILHLRKSDWVPVHEWLCRALTTPQRSVDVVEKKAYVREDDTEFARANDGAMAFTESEVEVKKGSNYSSLHYILKIWGGNRQHAHHLEVQVRTVFDEGWGEIDHQLRYPNRANRVVERQLVVLNKAASIANDIASAISELDSLPRFIPWKTALELERSSVKVACISPSLTWALEHVATIRAQLAKSNVCYVYFVPETPDLNGSIERLQNALMSSEPVEDEDIRTLERAEVLDRIAFVRVKMSTLEKLPFSADILLLQKSFDTATFVERDLGIIGAPTISVTRPEDRQDMLISDERGVKALKAFFVNLASSAKRRDALHC